MRVAARHIHRSAWHSRGEIQELLQAALAAELLAPSPTVWIVSPWVSDLPLIDNRSGHFNSLSSEWGQREVRLGEALGRILEQGSEVRLATRPGAHNARFIERLRGKARQKGTEDRLHVMEVDELHEKGILADTFYLSGSMNLTYNGVELLEEAVKFEVDPERIAETRLAYHSRWGGRLKDKEP